MRSTVYAAFLSVCSFSIVVDCAPTMDQLIVVETALASLKRMIQDGPPKDCSDLQAAGQTDSGVYKIFPFGDDSGISVYCDMETDGGAWTVIQRRGQFGNPVYYFHKDWEAYANGFGDPSKEYWLGNRAIHALTSNQTMALRFQLKNHTGETVISDYSVFKVGSEEDFFALTVEGYSGKEGKWFLLYQ